jgi:hypothetical protein
MRIDRRRFLGAGACGALLLPLVAKAQPREKIARLGLLASGQCRVFYRASAIIPIVGFDYESDPVAAGYAARLARPGGNVTGVFLAG